MIEVKKCNAMEYGHTNYFVDRDKCATTESTNHRNNHGN